MLKIAAILWYKVELSRLNEYPIGMTKLLIDLGVLCFSILAIIGGSTVSVLAVE